MAADLAVIVTARNEADRLAATLRALRAAFPAADLWVADDASDDATAHVALQEGARLVRTPLRVGKGGAATRAAEAVLRAGDPAVLLADADLGDSARELRHLVDRLDDDVDIAIATFAQRVGGGLGVAVGFARWAIARATGRAMQAPLSGQRALRAGVLRCLLPFAPGFGMETGMTIDALRRGLRVAEVELELEHRATGRTLAGFLHRGRQLKDIASAYVRRLG